MYLLGNINVEYLNNINLFSYKHHFLFYIIFCFVDKMDNAKCLLCDDDLKKFPVREYLEKSVQI